jgi:lipopolysaccharide transport system ATP-binding protein
MIKIEGISKQFKLYHSPADRLKEIVYRKKYHKDFVALNNISFEVKNGETLGIIGQNGAGKSTLLKILSGIVIPDKGTILVDGKVTGLLELGTGFNAEMTGLENIYMNGTLIGMTKEEIGRKKQAIIDFSELGEFINEPIKTYSSGMTMRLAFSIATHADPTCFLVDEALSVGDAYFQQKCMRKIQEFRAAGGSIIFVSHDMNAITAISDNAIWLKNGIIEKMGKPSQIVDCYMSEFLEKISEIPSIDVSDKQDLKPPVTLGGGTARLTEVISCKNFTVLNEMGDEISHILSNEEIIVEVIYFAYQDIINLDYGIQLRNQHGIEIFAVNCGGKGISVKKHLRGTTRTIRYKIKMNVKPGEYFFSIGVGANPINQKDCIFERYLLNIWDIKKITVQFNKGLDIYYGLTQLENSIEIIDLQSEKQE